MGWVAIIMLFQITCEGGVGLCPAQMFECLHEALRLYRRALQKGHSTPGPQGPQRPCTRLEARGRATLRVLGRQLPPPPPPKGPPANS